MADDDAAASDKKVSATSTGEPADADEKTEAATERAAAEDATGSAADTAADVPTDTATDAAADVEAVEPESGDAQPDVPSDPVEETEVAEASEPAEATEVSEVAEAQPKSPISHVKLALIAGLVLVLALAGLTGWLGYRAYQSHQADEQSNLFLQVGRQGAVNLTTIDWQNAEADVQRVLDSSTGTFYDDFQSRAQPFIEVVKQAQSKSVGTISEAGLESESDNEAKVLVAVTVNTTNLGAPEQQPRSWRMRITVEKVGDEAKVSNVEFVP